MGVATLRVWPMYLWKVPHMLKGMLTYVPALNAWRGRRATTGGSNSPRYCYSVWLRHLIMLDRFGFKISGAHVGELGPGDSIGIGLAAVLSGAARYVGLDLMAFSTRSNTLEVFNSLVELYGHRVAIPDHHEFPNVRPIVDSHALPEYLIDWNGFIERVERVRHELSAGLNSGPSIRYRAPWTSVDDIAKGSLDLVFSQAVLEHVDALEEVYGAMFVWLRRGGYASHIIDCGAHHISPLWNGHWAYSEWEWRLVRGQREFLLNREPLSTHLAFAQRVGFDTLLVQREYDNQGFHVGALSKRFRHLDPEDFRTRRAMLILRKR